MQIHSELEAAARQLLSLLPDQPPTQLLLSALSELPRRTPEAVALAVSSSGPIVRRGLGGGLTGQLLSELLLLSDSQSSDRASVPDDVTRAAASSRGGRDPTGSRGRPWASGHQSGSGGIIISGGGTSLTVLEVEERLREVSYLLGPELAYDLLNAVPALIRASPDDLTARLAALAGLLERPAPEAPLLAARHAPLLALPPRDMAAVGGRLRDALQAVLGWPSARVLHFLLWNPGVLASAALGRHPPGGGPGGNGGPERGGRSAVDVMCEQLEAVGQLAARRQRWQAAVTRGRYPLVAAALCGGGPGAGGGTVSAIGNSAVGGGRDGLAGGRFQAWADGQEQRLQRLRYCADSGALPQAGLRKVLLMHPVEFLGKCPSYRSWRLRRAAEARGAGPGVSGGIAGDGGGLPYWWGEPQLEVLGELGPYDRLM